MSGFNTLDDVSAAVETLRANHWDSEAAHGDADSIMVRALELIASGQCSEPEAIAKKALEVEQIDFDRWYA